MIFTKVRKAVAIVLLFALLFSTFPMSALANDTDNPEETVVTDETATVITASEMMRAPDFRSKSGAHFFEVVIRQPPRPVAHQCAPLPGIAVSAVGAAIGRPAFGTNAICRRQIQRGFDDAPGSGNAPGRIARRAIVCFANADEQCSPLWTGANGKQRGCKKTALKKSKVSSKRRENVEDVLGACWYGAVYHLQSLQ